MPFDVISAKSDGDTEKKFACLSRRGFAGIQSVPFSFVVKPAGNDWIFLFRTVGMIESQEFYYAID